MTTLIWWYAWGKWFCLVLGALICFWIYYDSRRKQTGTPMALTVGLVSLLAMVPSIVMAFSVTDWELALSTLTGTLGPLDVPGYIALAGVVGVVVAAIMYLVNGSSRVSAPMPSLPPIVPTIRDQQPPVMPTVQPRPAHTDPTQIAQVPVQAAGWLVFKSGSRAGRALSLKRGVNTIGRSSRCDLNVDDPRVSGEHARVIYENGQFVIYDMASLNHTFVNGHQVQKQMLMDGDEIRLGDSTTFVFKKA
jgi:hypothetical protein